jgi:LmbE family N-acetylglucosaminyl deacetylase
LIFAAHPDDEVLGCGGTAARMVKEGHTVTPIIFCENASVRYHEKEMRSNLEGWAKQCAEILGLSPPIFMGLPDQKLDTYSALEMAQTLEKVIREFNPQIIFTHHGGDINRDHQVIFDATLVAARPLPKNGVRTIYSYETISSTEWSATDFYSKFTPTTFFDIRNTLDLKLTAFSKYKSEVKEYPHPRSLQAIEVRARDWGSRVGLHAAEAFQLVRALH